MMMFAFFLCRDVSNGKSSSITKQKKFLSSLSTTFIKSRWIRTAYFSLSHFELCASDIQYQNSSNRSCKNKKIWYYLFIVLNLTTHGDKLVQIGRNFIKMRYKQTCQTRWSARPYLNRPLYLWLTTHSPKKISQKFWHNNHLHLFYLPFCFRCTATLTFRRVVRVTLIRTRWASGRHWMCRKVQIW